MSNSWGEPALSAAERARRYNQEAMAWASDDPTFDDDLGEMSPSGRAPRHSLLRPKRRRTSATASFAGASSLASSNVSPRSSAAPAPVRVKSEAEVQALEHLQTIPPEQRVKVYVGKNNTALEMGLEDLDKSPVLRSLISELGTAGSYIMHPKLMAINADHFQSIREFLLTDEYMPALVNSPHGENVLPKQLDSCTTPDHYRREALRAGNVYVIAEMLGMTNLQDLVFRKITQAQFHPYGVGCLLDLAMTIFSRPDSNELKQKGNVKQPEDGGDLEDGNALENWLINSIKDQFQRTMVHHAQHFFRVADHGACRRRGFGLRVLRSKVEDWDALGPDVVTIEEGD